MKKIVVTYWSESLFVPYFENNSVFEYSIEKQNEIIQKIINCGFSVMIRPYMGSDEETLLIYIGTGTFN